MTSEGIATKKIVLGGLFAAMVALFTMLSIQLPSSFGYIHLGDAVIFCAVYVLGGYYAVLAAAVGSVLSDIALGYAIYAPATFIIKGLVAWVAILLSRAFPKKFRVFAYIIAALIIPLGYFLYETVLFDISTAIVNLPYNLIQMTVGSIIGYILTIAAGKLKLHNN